MRITIYIQNELGSFERKKQNFQIFKILQKQTLK